MSARRVGLAASRALQQQAHRSAPVALQLPLESASSSSSSSSGSSHLLLAAAGVTTAVSFSSLFLSEETRCDAKLPAIALPSAAELAPTSLVGDSADANAPSKPRGRRNLLKNRTRHKAKLEEVDLMKIHLDEYKKARTAFDSPVKRFELYASATIASDADETNDGVGVGVGVGVAAMTFTDFVHSQILPRFHTRLPHPDVVYECEFVGNANGLITYEEFYLLNHLLKIPKEHFDVAFCMFDLDGDGAVDKDEFCHVIENLLKAISAKEGFDTEEQPRLLHVSAESTLPRLTKYLFGRYGKKKIRAADLEAALDVLRKQIIKAEFELYAKPHPQRKNVDVISVHDFAITMLNCFDADRLPPYLERVEQLNSSDAVVGWEDFFNFYFYVQSNLADIKLAFELTGADEITEADFVRAAQVVTGVELPFPVVQLAFRVFDGNDNGTLDRAELLKVLEMRTTVETQRHRGDSKFQRFTQCMKGPAE